MRLLPAARYVLLVSLMASSGCASPMDVTMRNPVAVGGVDSGNTIQHSRRNSRPIRATLASVDPQRICLDLAYARARKGELPRAAPRFQRMMLKGDNGWDRSVAFESTTIKTTQRAEDSVSIIPLLAVRSECRRRAANGDCDDRVIGQDSREVSSRTFYYESFVETRACFPNLGQVTKDTTKLQFRMHRLTFRWGLDGRSEVQRHGAQVLVNAEQ